MVDLKCGSASKHNLLNEMHLVLMLCGHCACGSDYKSVTNALISLVQLSQFFSLMVLTLIVLCWKDLLNVRKQPATKASLAPLTIMPTGIPKLPPLPLQWPHPQCPPAAVNPLAQKLAAYHPCL